MTRTNIALCLWAAITLFTFGHSASQPKVCLTFSKWEECSSADKAFDALAASVFWPLYWSWELQE